LVFFKQKTAYEIGLGIPAEPLFRSGVIILIEKTVTQFCRKLAAERPLKDIRDEYNYPKKKGIKDECSRLLEASTMKSRRGFAIQIGRASCRERVYMWSVDEAVVRQG